MKTLIAIMSFAALTAAAQLQLVNTNGARYLVATSYVYLTIPSVCTNRLSTVVNSNLVIQGDTVSEAFGKVNSSLQWLQTNQSGAVSGDYVTANTSETMFYTNPVTFGASNYWGQFTNVYSFTSSGTASTTNIMSVNGGAWTSWQFTNPFALVTITNIYTNWINTNFVTLTNYSTNTTYLPIQLATLSTTSTGRVLVTRLSNKTLAGRTWRFEGATIDFTNCTILNWHTN